MSNPVNPNTIVVQNSYYPRGLTEQMVWNHYNKHRNDIITEVHKRPILMFIYTKLNEYIIRRFIAHKQILLTPQNYDTLVHGRMVSISVEQPQSINYFCIDIDVLPTTLESTKKEAVADVIKSYNDMKDKVSRIKVCNSANGYHVYGYLHSSTKSEKAVLFLQDYLRRRFKDKYTVGARRSTTPREIVLDLTPMYYRGSHTVPWALCRNGLVCMDITETWNDFNREHAIVKV